MTTQELDALHKRAVEEQRAYLKEWRAKNRDRVRKYNAQYWERKAARALAKEVTPDV